MARTSSEKKTQAEEMFKRGEKLADIAAKLRVSEGTVRSWKARGKWGASGTKTTKKNNKSVAKNVAMNATENATLTKNVAKALQKKKGAPKGNQNAKGAKGNPHPVPKTPPDRTSHGGYRATPVFFDQLDDEEKELFFEISVDEEAQLIEQLRFITIRERRIMKAIGKYLTPDIKQTEIGSVEHDGNVESFTETQSQNNDLIIIRLEQELSTVQGKKTKIITELANLHMAQKKLENTDSGGNDDLIKLWADKLREIRTPKGGNGDA